MPTRRNPKGNGKARPSARRNVAPALRMLLLRKYEFLYDRALAAADRHGYGYVTPAMARLFVQVSKGPMSISELSRRLAISRQSLHQTVSAACERGLIELTGDSRNQRIRIVRFTDAGERMSRAVIRVDRRMERELALRIGLENVSALKRILAMKW